MLARRGAQELESRGMTRISEAAAQGLAGSAAKADRDRGVEPTCNVSFRGCGRTVAAISTNAMQQTSRCRLNAPVMSAGFEQPRAVSCCK
jgi:hypothetical protein